MMAPTAAGRTMLAAEPNRSAVSLEDKYELDSGAAFMTGTQALVRVLIAQRRRDCANGLNTAGFVSGYRGSPLGGLDQAMLHARGHLDAHHIKVQPGVNEELAATSVWGSQQLNLFAGARYDGVFGMWYGKGPGVDRSGDAFKHGNSAGTSRHGGVLVLAGDDHGAKSSTLAHQSEHTLAACLIPVLYPASVQEYLDYGAHGYEMSRFSGCWVAMKCVTDLVESGAIVETDWRRQHIVLPREFPLPGGGLNIRWPDAPREQETRLVHHKLPAALAYARANLLDRSVWDSPGASLGIIAAGKAYADARQALEDLGIDERIARDAGIRLYKVAMPWPLEPEGARRFAEGLEEIVVIEEKRPLIETQLRDQLYAHLRAGGGPRVVGKSGGQGEWTTEAGPSGQGLWLPADGELSPRLVRRLLADRLAKLGIEDRLGEGYRLRLQALQARDKALLQPRLTEARSPYFCSGCPHNTSTRVPEGSRATAGIGCHFMAAWMDRSTSTYTQMGGEGAPWIGQAPFTEDRHIFVNMGDGTYFHSGVMAVRAAVAAKVTCTFKILFNDAVAMTGGQRHDGALDPVALSRQIRAEGVNPVVIVTDQPGKYRRGAGWPAGVTVRDRDDLDAVQRELRERPGVSAIVYDQTCAAEKRRRRKRGEYPDPPRRVIINHLVCEGCGDCGTRSNCLSVEPLDTEFGRKREINQSSCNKDYSCIKGFCPSFVTVDGTPRRKTSTAALPEASAVGLLPDPVLPALAQPYQILVAGIGGTGVITIGQVLAVAAHIEGKAATVLDMSGLAQKGGPVMSHVRLAQQASEIHTARVGVGAADLVIGCDEIVASGAEAIATMSAGSTRAVLNSSGAPTAEFMRNPEWRFPAASAEALVRGACGADNVAAIEAGRLATALMGDAIATNMFMLGFAWQRGWIPIGEQALLRAIELNGVAVQFNQRSFAWGRRAASNLASVQRAATPAELVSVGAATRKSRNLDEMIDRRVEFLTGYQDEAYAARYRSLVNRVREAEGRKTGGRELTEAVARYFFKLLAYKDEYEVARLHADPAFLHRVRSEFEGGARLRFHLAPPSLSKPDGQTGEARKREFGPWILPVFRLLAWCRFLRGTAFDPFGRTAERRAERSLIARYESTVRYLIDHLESGNAKIAAAIAAIPEEIRGYGHIKSRNLLAAQKKEAQLLDAFHAAVRTRARAA